MKHAVVWHTPAPLWTEALKDGGSARFRRPELLRFARDTFMEDVQQTLATDPAALAGYVARRETWREPAAGWLPERSPAGAPAFDPAAPLKLYQPVHQRFYLVAAHLVCQVHGLPDKQVDAGRDERAAFVLRRHVPGQAHEYGWFGRQGWKPVNTPTGLDHRVDAQTLLHEERLPLFPLSFPNGNGRPRRMLAGLLPVAAREAYEAAPRAGAAAPAVPAGDPLSDLRRTQFDATVVQAFAGLANALADAAIAPADARDVLLFGLLDLAEFLEAHLRDVWDAVAAGGWTGPPGARRDVFTPLDTTDLLPGQSWRAALVAYGTGEGKKKVLAGQLDDVLTLTAGQLAPLRSGIQNLGIKSGGVFHTRLAAVLGTLPPAQPSDVPGAPEAVEVATGATYVVRCVYERPRCAERGLGPVVSDPSHPFQLASFFDPDAPARPLRVTLPVDTSVGGLRKSAKGVSFVFSKQLRDQVDRIKNAKFEDLDNGDVDDSGGLGIGMICAFSIPIITICAMILLMIIIQLLNIVFWWLPFFRICLPIPVPENR